MSPYRCADSRGGSGVIAAPVELGPAACPWRTRPGGLPSESARRPALEQSRCRPNSARRPALGELGPRPALEVGPEACPRSRCRAGRTPACPRSRPEGPPTKSARRPALGVVAAPVSSSVSSTSARRPALGVVAVEVEPRHVPEVGPEVCPRSRPGGLPWKSPQCRPDSNMSLKSARGPATVVGRRPGVGVTAAEVELQDVLDVGP